MKNAEIPSFIREFHNGRHSIAETVVNSANNVLNAIDLDSLLTNPVEYMRLLGNEWMKTQQPNFKKAYKIGRKHGKQMVKYAK